MITKNKDNKDLKTILKKSLLSKTFFIKTYGCQMNVNDSYSAKAIFEDFGMSEVTNENEADLIMISTCCVREKAELKVYSYIGLLKKLKRINPELIIIISGCMSEQESAKKNIYSKFPYVDIVVGTSMLPQLPYYINECLTTHKRVNYELELAKDFKLPIRTSERVSEFVTIMTGCNNFCSYCIVPHVRGREVSRDPEEILSEINKFVENGCREVTLLGQNVNSYGLDKGSLTFAGLLKRVADETDVERIRFMTSHPKDLTDEVIRLIAENPKLCNHIHLPLQSGSDDILKMMNRKYNKERYMHIIDYARKLIKDIEFTTDIIVGFPGETEKDFNDTLEFVKKIRFASAYTFMYSSRSGTPAADFKDHLSKSEKSARLTKLMDVEAKIKKEIYTSYVDSIQEVLVEGISQSADTLTGKTSSGITVNFNGAKEDIGKLMNLKITKAKTNTLFAQKVEGK